MFRIIYPIKDATIYDKYPERNTGIDQILELTKNTLGSPYQSAITEELPWAETYNSRILIKFDLTPFQTLLSENNVTSYTSYLKLFTTEAEALQNEYTVLAYPIAEDWRNGNGNYNDKPEISNGVTWYWKSGESVADNWSIGNGYQATHTTGGGSWHTSSIASQSFSFDDPTINMNVHSIVSSWLSGSIINHGFILKHSASAETDTNVYGSLKFFSRDTHTVYIPKLILYYSETEYTGGFTTASLVTDDYVIHAKNLRSSYRESDEVKIRYQIRDLYPTQTYQSSSSDYSSKRLPTSSYYSIIDSVTKIPVVDFNTIGTKISSDDYGHYIKINFASFLPERYYRIIYKVIYDGQTKIIDPKHDFKISR